MSHIHVLLRCSAAVFFNDRVLLVSRREHDDWVLPGGTPRPGEDLLACVRRELREETGMLIDPGACALIVETACPYRERLIDLVFRSPERPAGQPRTDVEGVRPSLIPINQIDALNLHPPIARYLKAMHEARGPVAPRYLRQENSEAATIHRPAGAF